MEEILLGHTGTVEIETKRLFLRRFTFDDANDMLRNWISNPVVQKNYGEPIYETDQAVNELLNKWISDYNNILFYRWAIILKENNENIGQIAFCRVYAEIKTAEIEYCIGEGYWGNGYATEALDAVIKFSFEQPKFDKLEAFHRIVNPRSGRVLEKTIMKKAKNVRRFEIENKQPDNEICYAVNRDEYFTNGI